MFPFHPFQRLRRIGRLAKIGEVAVRHGFGYLAEQIRGRRFRRKERIGEEAIGDVGARLRRFLEELGSTFIKLGQVASTRIDIFPPPIIEELKKLQDEVPPAPFPEIKAIIEKELKSPLEEIFRRFEEVPLACASLAQVHLAETKEGKEVVVKVQRPGVEKRVLEDLEILLDVCRMAEKRVPRAREYGVYEIAREIASAMRRELNFLNEAGHADMLRRVLSNELNIYIPRVIWELSTPYVLTMERVKGIKIKDFPLLEEAGFKREELAERLAEIFFKQVIIYGVFHADPHPGNIFVLHDGRIALTDFGLVGVVNRHLREQLFRLAQSLVAEDVEGVVEVLFDIGIVPEEVDELSLSADIENIFSRFYFIPPRKWRISDIYYALSDIMRKYRIRMPPAFPLLGRAMAELEGFCLQLDPNFNPQKIAEPLLRKFMRERFTPTNLWKELFRQLKEGSANLVNLPKQFSQVLSKADKGMLKVRFEYEKIDRPLLRLNIIANRLSFSIIVSAILLASSLIMQTNIKPYIWGYPALGIIGYLLAGIMGLWLLISIIRSGRL